MKPQTAGIDARSDTARSALRITTFGKLKPPERRAVLRLAVRRLRSAFGVPLRRAQSTIRDIGNSLADNTLVYMVGEPPEIALCVTSQHTLGTHSLLYAPLVGYTRPLVGMALGRILRMASSRGRLHVAFAASEVRAGVLNSIPHTALAIFVRTAARPRACAALIRAAKPGDREFVVELLRRAVFRGASDLAEVRSRQELSRVALALARRVLSEKGLTLVAEVDRRRVAHAVGFRHDWDEWGEHGLVELIDIYVLENTGVARLGTALERCFTSRAAGVGSRVVEGHIVPHRENTDFATALLRRLAGRGWRQHRTLVRLELPLACD